MRLCFSLCSPSVTLYISLKGETQHFLQTHCHQMQLELGAVSLSSWDKMLTA